MNVYPGEDIGSNKNPPEMDMQKNKSDITQL